MMLGLNDYKYEVSESRLSLAVRVVMYLGTLCQNKETNRS